MRRWKMNGGCKLTRKRLKSKRVTNGILKNRIEAYAYYYNSMQMLAAYILRL